MFYSQRVVGVRGGGGVRKSRRAGEKITWKKKKTRRPFSSSGG